MFGSWSDETVFGIGFQRMMCMSGLRGLDVVLYGNVRTRLTI